MKKYFTLMILAVLGGLFVMSCDRTDTVVTEDNDTYPVMKDVTGTFTNGNTYTLSQSLNIANSDVVLVYRNYNSNTSNSAVWQLIPKTYYLSGGNELDYNFLFDASKVEIYTEANFDQTTMTTAEKNTYLNNQTFRIVLVPASRASRTSAAAPVNYEDYNAVVKYYNLKEPK
jgi:hypothetical protein